MKPTLTDIQKKFWWFVEEREWIRLRKNARIPKSPFTQDPILAQYRFCNVNREHDAVTIWIRDNVRNRYLKKSLNFMIVQLLTCRIFNEPKVLRHLLPFTTPERLIAACALAKREHGTLLRGAYMMPSHSTGISVPEYFAATIQSCSDKLAARPISDYLRSVAEVLMDCQGVGPFLANQVCTDLRYVAQAPIWRDWETFVLAGPGTIRGLDRYFGTDDRDAKAAQDRLLWVRANHAQHFYPKNLPLGTFRDINNLSNCFCEFDKYMRVATGEVATLKRRYP